MVKFVKSENLSDENCIKSFRTNPSCTTEDMADYIKPISRRKPDIILIHTGTNDLPFLFNFTWIGRELLYLQEIFTNLFLLDLNEMLFDIQLYITDSTNQVSLNQNILLDKLKELRLDNPKNLTLTYLNINSVRNKFDSLQEIVMGKVDILIVAETKIDASFPTAQFSAEGYHKPYRLDVSEKSGSILVYINSSIPSRQLHCGNLNLSIQAVPFEINLWKDS